MSSKQAALVSHQECTQVIWMRNRVGTMALLFGLRICELWIRWLTDLRLWVVKTIAVG